MCMCKNVVLLFMYIDIFILCGCVRFIKTNGVPMLKTLRLKFSCTHSYKL